MQSCSTHDADAPLLNGSQGASVMPTATRDAPLVNTSREGQPRSQHVINEIGSSSILIPDDGSSLKKRRACLPDISQGSTLGTTFNMCSAILGAGALSLPHAVYSMGVVPAFVLLTLTAFATHFSVVILIDAVGVTNTKSFEDLTLVVFGKVNGRLVELSIIVFQFGTLIAYTVAIGDILEPLTHLPAVAHAVPWMRRDYIIVFFWSVIMLPLSFVEKISALQFTSLFGVLALAYLVLAVAVHFCIDAALDEYGTLASLRYAVFDAGAVSASAIVMFAFTCQINVPALYDELRVRTPAEMRRVSRGAVLLCYLCYCTVGFTGYADFPQSTQGNLLKNYCLVTPDRTAATSTLSTGTAFSHMPRVITAAFGAIALTITMAYPVNVFPTRYTIDLYFNSRLGETKKRLRHVGITLAIAGSTLALALLLDDISTVFSLMGGTASAYVCYVIPASAAWKLRDRMPCLAKSRLGKASCLALIAFGVLVGVLSTATTIAGLFDDSPKPPHACDTMWNRTHHVRQQPHRLAGQARFGEKPSWAWLW